MKHIIISLLIAFSAQAQVTKLLVGNKTAAAATTYGYLIAFNGDTVLDSAGDTVYVPLSYIELEQFIKNNEKYIISKHLFAVLPERKGANRYVKYDNRFA